MITDLEIPRITIKDFTFNRFTIKTTSNIEQTTSYRLYLSMFKNDNIIILTKEKTERKMNNYRLDYWKRQQLLTTEIIPIFHTFFLFFFFFFHPFYVSFHSLLRPFQSSSKVDFFFKILYKDRLLAFVIFIKMQQIFSTASFLLFLGVYDSLKKFYVFPNLSLR